MTTLPTSVAAIFQPKMAGVEKGLDAAVMLLVVQ